MDAQREEVLFTEVFYRRDKKFIEEKVHETNLTTALMLFGGFLGLGLFIFLMLFRYMVVDVYTIFYLFIIVCWIIWMIYLHIHTYDLGLTYIKIVPEGIKIIRGLKEWRFYRKEDVNKIVINLRKKRREIHLKDGTVIYLKRPRSEDIEHEVLTYDQFERFKKAMNRIGVKYEIVYK